jgi:CRISPR-associated protein Cmr2
MKHDYFAWLQSQEEQADVSGISGLPALGDECLLKAAEAPSQGQKDYRQNAPNVLGDTEQAFLPLRELGLDDPSFCLLQEDWFALSVRFQLRAPWHAKDDRPSHPLYNPVRKDPVFGIPCLPASSWKGLLRWACRMEAGLLEHLEKHSGNMLDETDWKDDEINRMLFGNEKGDDRDFQQGVLSFYPTWFDQVGFEVINPHDRTRRAGTHPIYYEVVSAGTTGNLHLLYAPPPNSDRTKGVDSRRTGERFLGAIHCLLTQYGISAKRTAGWGVAEIEKWHLHARTTEESAQYYPSEDLSDGVPQSIVDAAVTVMEKGVTTT